METIQKTSSTFTILVEIFLGLITTKALDTSLHSYKHGPSLLSMNGLFLICLLMVLIHSFSVLLQFSSQDTYSALLNQSKRRRRVHVLVIGVICVFVILYLMADFFSGTATQFLVASLLLSLGWFAIDLNAAHLIKAHHSDNGRIDEAETDPLFIATRTWWILDVIMGITFLLLLLSIRTSKMREAEAAGSMVVLYFAAIILAQKNLSMSRASE